MSFKSIKNILEEKFPNLLKSEKQAFFKFEEAIKKNNLWIKTINIHNETAMTFILHRHIFLILFGLRLGLKMEFLFDLFRI